MCVLLMKPVNVTPPQAQKIRERERERERDTVPARFTVTDKEILVISKPNRLFELVMHRCENCGRYRF